MVSCPCFENDRGNKRGYLDVCRIVIRSRHLTEACKNSALLMQVLVNGNLPRVLSAMKSLSHGSHVTSTLHDGIFEFEAASAPVLRKFSTDSLERFPVDSFADASDINLPSDAEAVRLGIRMPRARFLVPDSCQAETGTVQLSRPDSLAASGASCQKRVPSHT